jgi:hypothetical protein
VGRDEPWPAIERAFGYAFRHAPDGYEPILRVYLAHVDDPIDVMQAATTTEHDDPWVALAKLTHEPDDPIEKRGIIFVREVLIDRIEILYLRSEGPGKFKSFFRTDRYKTFFDTDRDETQD